jgi:hypothetical protein
VKAAIPPEATGPALPSAYARFRTALDSGYSLSDLGFRTTRAEVFRFANRFRVARAFRGVDLTHYSAPTVRAYGALFRIFVTWSCLEQYLKVLGAKDGDALLESGERQACLAAIRAADTGGNFVNGVCDRTRDLKLVRVVKLCINGTEDRIVPVVRAVRHSFAHGDLAPGANRAKPGVAQAMAKSVCPILLEAIDRDFTRRVEAALV